MNSHLYYHTDAKTDVRIFRASDGSLTATVDDGNAGPSVTLFMSDTLAERIARTLLAEVSAAAEVTTLHGPEAVEPGLSDVSAICDHTAAAELLKGTR
jgi:hypothetical protein